ncbi:3'-5' exonuclease [Gordonia bronchialis]|uniref:exonuclease domain-containing protein n=1 Tax=Gordonia bronchialis TaxID=2054 RepID=UPI001CBF531D|nr:exonuclease domain-containing protein [Gordonia bronchialis]UAK38383.1 3'-5' exonuclease [Gordonia bronchialis]
MDQMAIDGFGPWVEHPLACFDVESTGPNPTQDRVVTACIARIDITNGKGEIEADNWLLNPGIEIPQGAIDVHGVTNEVARTEGSDYEEGLLAIWAMLQLLWGDGRIVAAYNGSFDLTMMTSELRRLGHDPGDVGPMVDPHVLDKHFDKYRKGSRKLTAVCEHYGVELGDAHNAAADALGAARLAWVMPRRFPELATLTAAELQEKQALWYADQKRSLFDYLRRKGESVDDESTDWPIRKAA